MERILTNYKFTILNKIARRFFRNSLEARYLRNFFTGVDYPEATRGKVLLYAGIGHMYLTPLEIFLYHVLRKEGYEVDYYVYDEFIPAHELITEHIVTRYGQEKFLTENTAKAAKWLQSANVSYSYIQKDPRVAAMLDPVKNDLQAMLEFVFDGVHFGNIIRGAMYRYYRSLTFGDGAVSCAYNYLQTSLINYFQVKNLNEDKHYKFVLFSHGINCTWEPVVEYCKRYDVKFVCYDRAKRLASANFNINQPSPVWNFDSAWERYSERSLSSEEDRWVDDQMGKRELHTGDVYAYNLTKRTADLQVLREKLAIKKDAKVLTIFTNLIWDAANVSRDIAFRSALDCIEQVIQKYANDERIHILLRPHPAEKIIGTDESYSALVCKIFKDRLPYNYSVIDPVEVNSFSVIDITDIGVVNTSTVGLELAMLGKPAILISDTHYRNKGFTSDAISSADFFEKVEYWLNNAEAQVSKPLARKYFFMMMNLYQKNTPLIMEQKVFNGYAYRHFNDVPAKDDIVRVVKDITEPDRKDFVWWE